MDIGFCTLSKLSLDEVKKEIRRLSEDQKPHYIVTPNIDHIHRLMLDQDANQLQTIYRNASLSLCDSRILELMLRINGLNAIEVITGSGLTKELFDQVLNSEDRIFILGANGPVVDKIRKKYPQLKIFHHNPSMGFIERDEDVEMASRIIQKVDPNYLFLAVGSPQQEYMAKKLCETKVFKGVALCVGASLLFLAGVERRAPAWLQALRLEWLYRLLQSPGRLGRRYLGNAKSLYKIHKMLARL